MGTMMIAGREQVVAAFLAWGDPITDVGAAIGELHFDVVKSEHHERTSVITEHSVETGVAVADHVRPNVDKLELVVHVSQVPINSPDAVRNVLTLPLDRTGQVPDGLPDTAYEQTDSVFTVIQSLRGVQQFSSPASPQLTTSSPLAQAQPTSKTVFVDQFDGEIDYVDNCYATLTTLRNTATLLRVQCPRAYYDDMVIESIEMDRDAATGTGADFTLEFRQIRIVSSQVVDAPKPKAVKSQPSADVGKKDAKPADDAKGSLLKRKVLSKFIAALTGGSGANG